MLWKPGWETRADSLERGTFVVMRRVLVIGIPGAGKSTFARALAARTGLPLIHLDKEFWQPGWRVTPRTEWWARVSELAAGKRWLMEGNYASSLHLRLPRADTVLWFDYPRVKCLGRVLRRIATTYGQVRPDMAPGCPEQLDWEFLRYVWRFNRLERPKVVAALEQHGQHVVPVVFRRDGEVAQFLSRLD
jgi:adenylate kinase family enzyme